MVILQLSMKRLQISFRKSAQEFLIVESTTSIYNLISKIDSKAKKHYCVCLHQQNSSYTSWQQAKQSGK